MVKQQIISTLTTNGLISDDMSHIIPLVDNSQVSYGVHQLLASLHRYFSQVIVNYIQHFQSITYLCIVNNIFHITPQVFNWLEVRKLGRPLHNCYFMILESKFCIFANVFRIIFLKKHSFKGIFLPSTR